MTALAVVGPVGFLLSPYITELLGSELGWNEAERGIVASAELAGVALAALTAPLWVKFPRWKVIVSAALLIAAIGNLASMAIHGFAALAALRFVVGLMGGALAAIYITFLSYTRSPDRNASILIFCQVAFQAISFVIIPALGAHWGLAGLFGFIALLYVPILVFSKLTIPGPPTSDIQSLGPDNKDLKLTSLIPGFSILVASALFFITQVGVFAFFFDVGAVQNVSEDEIVTTLVVSTALALSAPIASYFIQDRLGLLIPLIVPAIGQVAILVWLANGGMSFLSFLIAASLFQVLWNFMLPYILVATVTVDTTHRLSALLPTFQALGIAIGPALVGSFMLGNGVWAIAAIGSGALIGYAMFSALGVFSHSTEVR